MPREREIMSKKIKTVDYDINDNLIRAWYNGAGELLFVLDETLSANKPNVLLVIDSFDERKWDDVLANDYGIDLETVRPKKDNKYQKLDIEYGGLDVYADLIEAYESDGDVDDALENLERFRTMSVRRSAKERLSAAEETANKSRETIERANDAISELRARVRELRTKLAEQKRNVGREPTKVSAAKILKTESQIDVITEKLSRAKKRLESAKRRLATAEDDAEIARAILAQSADVKSTRHKSHVVRAIKKQSPVLTESAPYDESGAEDEDFSTDQYDEEYEETEEYNPDTEEMTEKDETVKPLFDKDPEILDDNIAFKPIDFNANAAESVDTKPVAVPHVEHGVAPAPLSFVPPAPVVGETQSDVDVGVEQNGTMLDNLTSVEPVESEQIDVETTIEPAVVVPDADIAGDLMPVADVPVATIEQIEPITPVEPITNVRPVSPISGYDSAASNSRVDKKPTLIYYVMLILLIGLSIFTLWLYQYKNGGVLPNLTTTNTTLDVVVDDGEKTNIPSPLVKSSDTTDVSESVVEPVESVTEPEPVAAVIAEPETVAVVESEPVTEPKSVAIVEAANVVESPFVNVRTVATYEPEKKVIPTEEEVLARKPGYNVSQNEKMFVAAPDYDTETISKSESVFDEGIEDLTYSMDLDVQPVSVSVPEVVTSEVAVVEPDATMAMPESEPEPESCAGGAPADEYGCCPGEEYSYTDDGFMCCTDDGCFPPLQ